MNFYKRHIGDYIKDAGHLTLLEHGIYARLMDVYYTREAGIPEDKAARLIGARSKDEINALNNVLSEFFTLVEGEWIQARCEREIEAANVQAEANRNNGKRGGRPKRKETEIKPNGFPSGLNPDNENNLSQTPDTRHQTPDLKPKANTATAHLTEVGAKKAEGAGCTPGEISMAMRAIGVNGDPGDMRLKAISAQGVTLDTVQAACQEAKRSKSGEAISPGYIIAIIERWSREASKLQANGARPPSSSTSSKDASRAAAAASIGLGGQKNDIELNTIDGQFRAID